MARVSRLPEARLQSLYAAEDFGGEKTMRAKVKSILEGRPRKKVVK